MRRAVLVALVFANLAAALVWVVARPSLEGAHCAAGWLLAAVFPTGNGGTFRH